MFEVIAYKNDGSVDTYDCLDQMQAECVFFRARMQSDVDRVEIFETAED